MEAEDDQLPPWQGGRRLERQQLLDIIDFLPDATFVIDLDRRVIAWNRAMEALTGVKKEDILGQGDYAYAVPFYGDRRPILIDLLDQPDLAEEAKYSLVRRQGQRLYAEAYVPTVYNGAGAHLSGVISPLLDPADNRYGTIETIHDITAQKQVEMALRTSEVEYRSLFDSAPIGVFRSSTEGKLIAANPALARMFGYDSPEEMVRSVRDTADLYAGSPTRKEVMSELAEKGRIHFEKEFHRRDGCRLWAVVDMRLQRDPQGRPVRVVGFIEDVTERKRAGEERQRAEQQLSDIIDFLPDATLVIDMNKRVIAWNRAIEEMTGVKKADIIGQGDYAYAVPFYGQRQPMVIDLIGTEDPATEHRYSRLERVGDRVVAEVYLPDLYGTGAWVWAVASPLLDQSGKRYGAIESVRDITQRKRAEQALRDSEERYRALFQNNPAMFVTLSAGGDIISINKYGASQLGYTIQELEGQPVFRLLHESDHEAMREGLKACLENSPRVYDWTYRKIRKDGSTLWAEESARAVKGPDGTLDVLVVCHDITRRRQAEEERAKLQEQLQQAHKLESVGRLAGGVAHDFNNLLTVINGYADLALSQLRESEPLGRQVTQIRKAGGRAADLTQQLLAFSRKQIIQPQLLDLNTVVAESRMMLDRLLGEDIEVVTRLSPSLGLVMADGGQMHQVLMNLAVNSRDAMTKGGRLEIETANVVLEASDIRGDTAGIPGPYVLLSVKDSGPGMSREVLEHLFEPFFTTKEKGQGTGLGLSTVYGIVQQNGGSIRVDCPPGKGTTFRIYLPQSGGAAVTRPSGGAGTDWMRGWETILIVEDQQDVRALTLEMLRSCGYRTLEAANGGEALLLAERYPGPIHLTLTDVVMPGMSGKELADRFRLVRPATAVLYMSGYEDNTIADRGLLEPGTSCVLKPFTREVLAAKVRSVLDSRAVLPTGS